MKRFSDTIAINSHKIPLLWWRPLEIYCLSANSLTTAIMWSSASTVLLFKLTSTMKGWKFGDSAAWDISSTRRRVWCRTFCCNCSESSIWSWCQLCTYLSIVHIFDQLSVLKISSQPSLDDRHSVCIHLQDFGQIDTSRTDIINYCPENLKHRWLQKHLRKWSLITIIIISICIRIIILITMKMI